VCSAVSDVAFDVNSPMLGLCSLANNGVILCSFFLRITRMRVVYSITFKSKLLEPSGSPKF